MIARSWLFVPGDSERKLARAMSSDADAIIVDLEDAVLPERKDLARRITAEWLRARRGERGPAPWLRVNPLRSGLIAEDLAAVMPAALAGVVLPKTASVDDLWALDGLLSNLEQEYDLNPATIGLLAIATETAQSIAALSGYSEVPKRLRAISWGAEDLSVELGAAANRDAEGELFLTYRIVRSLAQIAAAQAGVAALETIYPEFNDDAGLSRIAVLARREGFAGMLAIHPSQVPIINAAFTPTSAEIARARSIVAAFESQPGAGAVQLDGRMLDAPHLRRAVRLLESL